MDNVYVITIKYKDEFNDHSKVDNTAYNTIASANYAAWKIFDEYLDDLVEYWDKRGDEDKTNRYTKFIKEIKDLKIRSDVDASYEKHNDVCRTYFSDIGGGKLVVSVKQLNVA